MPFNKRTKKSKLSTNKTLQILNNNNYYAFSSQELQSEIMMKQDDNTHISQQYAQPIQRANTGTSTLKSLPFTNHSKKLAPTMLRAKINKETPAICSYYPCNSACKLTPYNFKLLINLNTKFTKCKSLPLYLSKYSGKLPGNSTNRLANSRQYTLETTSSNRTLKPHPVPF